MYYLELFILILLLVMIHQFKNFSYDYTKGIIKKNEDFALTKIQKKLLNYFIDNPGQIFSKQELMENVWERIITENSVDQVISILRSHIEENPAKPQLIVTRYGQGFSFEGVEQEKDESVFELDSSSGTIAQQNNNLFKLGIVFVFLLLSWFVYHSFSKQAPLTDTEIDNDKKMQQLVVMPMTFADQSIAKNQQKGVKTLLKSSFANLDNEGEIIFDDASVTNKQAIEKYFSLEKKLLVINSQVKKVGNIYHATVEVNNGQKVIETKTLSANNLNELINSQIQLIATYQNELSNDKTRPLISKNVNQKYIQALGYQANGNIAQAKKLFEEVLQQQDDNYQARLALAKILFKQKEYDKSLAQLETLKSTPAYESIGTEIELVIADNHLVTSKYNEIIDNLKAFQLSHPHISEIKKARIKLIIARAYHAKGDVKTAMTFYKNALVAIKQNQNPMIFAQSFYGQAKILSAQSNGEDVFNLFEKSYQGAKSAGNVHHQVVCLNEMAKIYHYQSQWDKAIALQNKSLDLLELEKDQRATAVVLSTLIPILKQQGYLKESQQKTQKFGQIAKELNSDLLRLHYLHFKSEEAIDNLDFTQAHDSVNQHLALATKTQNYAMVLDNAFLEFEVRLKQNDLKDFKQEWDKRTKLIQEIGFERFQVYMDLYLARYYKQSNQDEKAIAQLNHVSEVTKATSDYNFFVEAQNYLAEITLKTDTKKALKILNNLNQYNPQPNPYLIVKAKVLDKLGKKTEALSLLNQAKLVLHENWSAENQIFLDSLKAALKKQ